MEKKRAKAEFKSAPVISTDEVPVIATTDVPVIEKPEIEVSAQVEAA